MSIDLDKIPLTRAGYHVFRGEPKGYPLCLGFLRKPTKPFMVISYTVDLRAKGNSIINSKEEIESLLQYHQQNENDIRKNIKKWIQEGRRYQNQIRLMNDISVINSRALSWNHYKKLASKRDKKDAIAWGIINRAGTRSYKTDSDRIHDAFDQKRLCENEMKKFMVPKDGEYLFSPYIGPCVCNKEKFIPLGTAENYSSFKAMNIDYEKEKKGEPQDWMFIRTKGDLIKAKKLSAEWLKEITRQRVSRFHRMRESYILTKAMIYELKRHRMHMKKEAA